MKDNFNITKTTCWKCGKKFDICMINYGTGHSKRPDDFSCKEIIFAGEHGIKIEKRNSSGLESVNACICPYCNNFYGNHYLLDDFMSAELGDGLSEIKNIKIDKECL